jgi:hypothetical protein
VGRGAAFRCGDMLEEAAWDPGEIGRDIELYLDIRELDRFRPRDRVRACAFWVADGGKAGWTPYWTSAAAAYLVEIEMTHETHGVFHVWSLRTDTIRPLLRTQSDFRRTRRQSDTIRIAVPHFFHLLRLSKRVFWVVHGVYENIDVKSSRLQVVGMGW